MKSLREIVLEKQKARELYQKEKSNAVQNKKLLELKENGKVISKIPITPPSDVPNGYRLVRIPENLDDLRIGKLRTLHADIFGKEPPHDSAHNKIWIANKIKAVLN